MHISMATKCATCNQNVTAKNGKLKSVECYFVERRTLLTEKV